MAYCTEQTQTLASNKVHSKWRQDVGRKLLTKYRIYWANTDLSKQVNNVSTYLIHSSVRTYHVLK